MSLTPVQTFYLQHHADAKTPDELAADLGVPARVVKTALKKLAKDRKVLSLVATAEVTRDEPPAQAPTPAPAPDVAALAEENARLKEENKGLKRGQMRATSVAMTHGDSLQYDQARATQQRDKNARLRGCIAVVDPNAPIH